MLRRWSRFLPTRVGRSLLILTALGLLWAAWWFWPERPLRRLTFDRAGHYDELAYGIGDGRTICISGPPDSNGDKSIRYIALQSGREIDRASCLQNPPFHSSLQIVSGPHNKSNLTKLTTWLLLLVGSDIRHERSFRIFDNQGLEMLREIPGDRWCGFAENERGWTQNSSGPQIILREWDISYPRPPVWLWLVTGGAGGFLIRHWRHVKPAR